jgi:transcriptional regulator with XRE-family HTH domain
VNLPELGAFLRSRRDRITPAEVGLPTGPRRRVPGLRRDEVATLAGASVDYYTELERGNGAQPSPQMLAALSRALRLDHDERDHLHVLTDRPLPKTIQTAHVEPAMLALLDRLDTTPARIITDLHETLVQNHLATALLGPRPSHTTSFVHQWFTTTEARRIYPEQDHQHHSKVLVNDLRAAAARRGEDQRTTSMITYLRKTSKEFTTLWDTGDVSVRRGDRKRIIHPELGTLDVHCQNLFSEDGSQRLQFFTAPPGSPAVDQLELLAVIGIQQITTATTD